ncbi:hypothetical protein LPB72_03560 [Hydrogenophaga crassostreae]|uniref:Lipoprotein n=1 Tax=Hydrogenophaga crassostreae TaxID=1763535 RepID=A0A167IUQ1_9BURK|nr:hypothetical protein [Hydrogenophaga crassostreae]AOW14361.1 hypothetical protein LPB072_17475 [Hydrogenophaga crassostreae]OAD43616.1 hypothetical protein LPB72_03560 [Hydrogenophaga crassostreae]
MPTLRRFAPTRSKLAWPASAILAMGLTACANGPVAPKALQGAAPVSHNCQPRETVGFSCELRDQRLLSLCASPDFLQFKGAPRDNPGYAYVAVGSPQGKVQFSYPEEPGDYKQHMYAWVSMSAAPHLFIAGEKGDFLHFSLDEKEPVSAKADNLPANWPLKARAIRSLCDDHINRAQLDPFMAQMPGKKEWEKGQLKQPGQ